MTAAVWHEGTAKRSAEEIASELGDMGASLSVAADWDTTSARLFSLKRHLPKALEIFADVLREAQLPQGGTPSSAKVCDRPFDSDPQRTDGPGLDRRQSVSLRI